MKCCFIFCSAKIEGYDYLREYDFSHGFVICADGGLRHAERLGITPDLWLGDNDSLKRREICAKEVKLFPTDKEKTDTEIAIDEALSRGFDRAIIIGGIGGRIDHEFSHFCLLKYALLKGMRCSIINAKNEITLICDSITLNKGDKKYVSFFPLGDAVSGLTIKGLKYETDNMELRLEDVRASSNEFADSETAEISIKSGFLLVILSSD